MKPIVLDNIFSEKELFYIYKTLVATPNWTVGTTSETVMMDSNKNYAGGAMFFVKGPNEIVYNHVFDMYGKILIFRIAKLLEEKKIGIHTNLERMWFLSSPTGSPLHFPHQDQSKSGYQSILLFMTPVWQTGWRGSFYVQGEEFKFKPGSAIIFDSQEFHTGEDFISETYNWQRITCNIVVGPNK